MDYRERIYGSPAYHGKIYTTTYTGSDGELHREYSQSTRNFKPHIWRPSWFQYRPILGLISLAIAIGCMAASFAVLFISNGKPVDTAFWNIQPTVYLAIAASLGAFAVRFAMTQAIPVAWWYRALNGRSIRQLQYQWEAGQSPLSAIIRFFHAPWISLTSLLLLLMLVDGAFLQRASTIVSATLTQSALLTFTLSPELPRGFSGNEFDQTIVQSPVSSAAFSDWLSNSSIPFAVDGCGATSSCSAKIHAPGLAQQNCSTIVQPISRAMLFNSNATWGNFHFVINASEYLQDVENGTLAVNPAFYVDMFTNVTDVEGIGPETIVVTTGRVSFTLKDGGNFTTKRCYLVPAILEYDVQFKGGNLILPADTSSNPVVAVANNTLQYDRLDHGKQPQTLLYFYVVYSAYSQVNATLILNQPAFQGESWNPDPHTLNAYALQFLGQQDFGMQFADPMPTIVSSFNNMMVRGSVAWSQNSKDAATDLLDTGVSLAQSVQGTSVTTLNVFRTEFAWFIAAAVIYLVVILAILPLFWGFWLSPKNCTLSPFEVSLAFRSPLFSNIHSTAGVDGIVENLGDVKIAYGVVEDAARSPTDQASNMSVTRLAFAGDGETRMPVKDMEIFA